MAWYYVLLIVIASIVGLFMFWKVLRLITRPKFKKQATFVNQKNDTPIVAKPAPVDLKGLSLDAKFKIEDEEENTDSTASINEINRQKMIAKFKAEMEKHNHEEKTKTLLDEINSLSPELKALIFDRGLARKEYDFNSKKD